MYEGITDETVDEFVEELHHMQEPAIEQVDHADGSRHDFVVTVTWVCRTCNKVVAAEVIE